VPVKLLGRWLVAHVESLSRRILTHQESATWKRHLENAIGKRHPETRSGNATWKQRRTATRNSVASDGHWRQGQAVISIRAFREEDSPLLWTLSILPNIGHTADPQVPLPLPPAVEPPASSPDLADVCLNFHRAGGDFLIGMFDGHLVGMGGVRPNDRGQAEVLRVRVHPAVRRRGVGRALMTALEARAAQLRLVEMHLDTATNQPEAMAFYRRLGYREVGREHQPGWSWTLVYLVKSL
jgi:ribosomal protein S18 acetylase RimI-like enzyme